YAPQPVTSRGQSVHLGTDPNGTSLLYANGRAVVVRDIAHPELAWEWTGHSCNATVARYSPSGFYIASGDVQGNIKIWDATQPEHIIKTETKVFSGRVSDIAWDFESKRLIAVGEGKDRFGHAFLFDTASSVGEISGHSKVINSVSIRGSRPLRAVTCSDDMTVNFYHGVPFKYNKTIRDHTRFVQCVRFSSGEGNHFVSAGMDAKLFLYDGKTGDKVAELSAAENSHTGGITSLSWSPDGKMLMTGSMDSTVKLWDVQAQKVVSTIAITTSGGIDDQQVGTIWPSANTLLSLSLSGDLNYLCLQSATPTRILRGHQKAITAVAAQPLERTLFTGSYDGRIFAWGEDGIGKPVGGVGHNNQVSSLALDSSTSIIASCGMDDTVRQVNTETKEFSGNVIATPSLPNGVASSNSHIFFSTQSKTLHHHPAGVQLELDYVPMAIDVTADASTVVVGGDDNKSRVYSVDTSGGFTLVGSLDANRGAVTVVKFSPDGQMVAIGDKERSIIVYDVASRTPKITQWMFHNARINSIAWSPDSLHAASGSLDTNVEIWSVEKPLKHITIRGSHLESANGVAWLDNETLASAGQDAFIKVLKGGSTI
ncbi:WD40-repeat-containing domain protein, partial [Cladochytrium replicatum]